MLSEALQELLGDALEALGRLLEALGSLLEHLGSLLGASDGSERYLLIVLEGSWEDHVASWSALGGLLDALGGLLGAS